MVKNNLYYFNFSLNNPENKIDEFYGFLNKNNFLDKYVEKTKEIKELLTTIKVLSSKNEDKNKIDQYFDFLFECLDSYSNCSEFICFANACDVSLVHIQKDKELLKKITFLYLEYRDISSLTPSEWIQALLDTHSSRKKGSSGDLKVLELFSNYGFNNVSNWNDFINTDRAITRFSKNDFGLENIRKELKIKIDNESQNKIMDLIIKCENQFFLLEAKHINVGGGGQDKQIKELIKNISLSETNKDVYYIAFLDGKYSNILLDKENINKKGKIAEQYKEILQKLNQNPQNYWLNTAGIIEFINDLVE